MTRDETGRARPPGVPQGRPQRKKLPHERPRWLRPEDEIFFITVCCIAARQKPALQSENCSRHFRFGRIPKSKQHLVRALGLPNAGPFTRTHLVSIRASDETNHV